MISTEKAHILHASFDALQLTLFKNAKDNLKSTPSARRYSNEVKEFSLTFYFYSPKAYRYARSRIPLPNLSLIQTWSSSTKCEPGFFTEEFTSLANEVHCSSLKKDCGLIIDAMSIRKQTIWNRAKNQYAGFVDNGDTIPGISNTLASETLVFLLVGIRSHWKCPIGYFLVDKVSAEVKPSW